MYDTTINVFSPFVFKFPSFSLWFSLLNKILCDVCVCVSVYLGVMEMFFVGLLLTISDSEWECGGDMTSVGVWGRHD